MAWSHPDIGMRSIFNLRPHREALQFRREDIKHGLPRNKRSGTQWNLEFITTPIIVSANLFRSLRHGDCIQGGNFGRIEVVQGRIDMPAVESSDTFSFIFWRNPRFVEGSVARMLQTSFSQTLVIVHDTIADKLYLGYRRDRLKIGMKNGFLGLASLIVSVAIAFTLRIKCLANQSCG